LHQKAAIMGFNFWCGWGWRCWFKVG